MIAKYFDRVFAILEDENVDFQEEKLKLFVRLFHLHLAIQYLAKPSDSSYFLTSVALPLAFLLCCTSAYIRLGIVLSTSSILVKIISAFPFNANHLYLEFLCLVLLALLSIGRQEERKLLLGGLKLILLIVFFYTGVQKCFYGTYFEAEYLGYSVSQQGRFAYLSELLIPDGEFTRLISLNPQVPGEGPFAVAFLPVIVASNLVYILEILLPFFLIPRRTRLAAAIFSMLFVLGFQLWAREFFFAGVFAMLCTLYLDDRRLIKSIYAFLVLFYLVWLGVRILWPDIFLN